MFNKQYLILVLLVSTTISSDLIINTDFHDADPLTFLSKYTWFDLKEYYNVASAEELEEISTKAENSLNNLKKFREENILKFLQEAVDNNCTWKKELEDSQKIKHKSVLRLFGGTSYYMDCDDFLFIFNFFGSETPTSDLDFGLYRITKENTDLDFNSELENVRKVNYIINYAINLFLNFVNRTDKGMQKLLDMNGYPDMFVVYDKYFRFQNARNVVNAGDSKVLNVFSAPLLRICFMTQIHIYINSIYGTPKDSPHRKSMRRILKNCVKTMVAIYSVDQEEIDDFAEDNLPFDYKKELRNELYYTHLTDSLENLFEMYAVNKLYNPSGFNDCIDHIQNVDIFMKFLNYGTDELTQRHMMFSLSNPNKEIIFKKETTFEVYHKIFYVESTETDSKNAVQNIGFNHLNMVFLASCFTLADEAYPTIGALEYVKFKSEIHSGEVDINCISLIEVFGDNVNMILSHISEDPSIQNELVIKHQSISDAFCKYLNRAMGIFKLGCLNIYNEKINSPLENMTSYIHIQNGQIFKFYRAIKIMMENKSSKLSNYHIFYSFFNEYTVNQMYDEVMYFYETMSKAIIDTINLYIFAPKDEDYIERLI